MIYENDYHTPDNSEKPKKRRKPQIAQHTTLPPIIEPYDDIGSIDESDYNKDSSEKRKKRRKPQIDQYTTLQPMLEIYDDEIEIMDGNDSVDYDAEYEEALLEYAKDYEQYLKDYAAWNEKYGDLYRNNAESPMLALSSSFDSSYVRRRRKKTRRRKQRYIEILRFYFIVWLPVPANKSIWNMISYFFIERTCLFFVGLGAKFLHNYHHYHHLHHTLL